MVKNELVKWFADSYVQKLFKAWKINVAALTVGILLGCFVPLLPFFIAGLLVGLGGMGVFLNTLCLIFNFLSSPEWDTIKA